MSTLRVNTLQNTSGVEVYTAKAWVNFNGTGTVAIRAAGNVSSITDNGTGDYTLNFTTALADANYAITVFANNPTNATPAGLMTGNNTFAPTTSSVRVQTVVSGNYGAVDTSHGCVAVFR